MLLETSRRYNPSIDSITFLKDFSYNKEDFAKAGAFVSVGKRAQRPRPHLTGLNPPCLPSSGLQFEFINPIFEFSKGMNDLHLDEAEYALLIAINIFSAGQASPMIKDQRDVGNVILPPERCQINPRLFAQIVPTCRTTTWWSGSSSPTLTSCALTS